METSKTPVNKPGNLDGYQKKNYVVGKWTLMFTFLGFALGVYAYLKEHANKPAEIVCSGVKKLSFTRSKDSCRAWQYLYLINKSLTPVLIHGLKLNITSLRKKSLHLELEADSSDVQGRKEPLTDLDITNVPLAGNFHFSTEVDSATLSNLPHGHYRCVIQAIVDTLGRTVDLCKYDIYLNDSNCKGFQGIRKFLRHGRHRTCIVEYPTYELDTN